MQEPPYVEKITLVPIWLRLELIPMITQKFKDSLTLTYSPSINFFSLRLWFWYPQVSFSHSCWCSSWRACTHLYIKSRSNMFQQYSSKYAKYAMNMHILHIPLKSTPISHMIHILTKKTPMPPPPSYPNSPKCNLIRIHVTLNLTYRPTNIQTWHHKLWIGNRGLDAHSLLLMEENPTQKVHSDIIRSPTNLAV